MSIAVTLITAISIDDEDIRPVFSSLRTPKICDKESAVIPKAALTAGPVNQFDSDKRENVTAPGRYVLIVRNVILAFAHLYATRLLFAISSGKILIVPLASDISRPAPKLTRCGKLIFSEQVPNIHLACAAAAYREIWKMREEAQSVV